MLPGVVALEAAFGTVVVALVLLATLYIGHHLYYSDQLARAARAVAARIAVDPGAVPCDVVRAELGLSVADFACPSATFDVHVFANVAAGALPADPALDPGPGPGPLNFVRVVGSSPVAELLQALLDAGESPLAGTVRAVGVSVAEPPEVSALGCVVLGVCVA